MVGGQLIRETARETNRSRPVAVWSLVNFSTAHARGAQALVDSLLLSRCDYLIKSASAVSEFALYWRPELANRTFDFTWVRGPANQSEVSAADRAFVGRALWVAGQLSTAVRNSRALSDPSDPYATTSRRSSTPAARLVNPACLSGGELIAGLDIARS